MGGGEGGQLLFKKYIKKIKAESCSNSLTFPNFWGAFGFWTNFLLFWAIFEQNIGLGHISSTKMSKRWKAQILRDSLYLLTIGKKKKKKQWS